MGFAKKIRMAMLDKDMKAKDIAEASGLKTHNVYNSLNKDCMTIERAELIADALGCKIIMVDKETGKEY